MDVGFLKRKERGWDARTRMALEIVCGVTRKEGKLSAEGSSAHLYLELVGIIDRVAFAHVVQKEGGIG